MLLVRTAQGKRVFAGGRENKRIGSLNAGLQGMFFNENHGAMGYRFRDRKDGEFKLAQELLDLDLFLLVSRPPASVPCS